MKFLYLFLTLAGFAGAVVVPPQPIETLSEPQKATMRAALNVVAAPVITGTAAYGETLTSTSARQWYANGVAIAGEVGQTLIVPTSLAIGTVINQTSSNSVTVIDALDGITWALRLQTSRGPEKATPPVAVGASVTSWMDQYGTGGRIATASTAPTLQTGNNGQRVVRFTGGQKITIPTATLTGDLTVVMVYQPSTVAAAGRNLIEGGPTYIQLQNSTSIRIKPTGTSSFVDLNLPRALTASRWQILTVVISGSTATVYLNGQAGESKTVAATTWQIQNLCEGLAGDVGAILIANSALSSTQRASVRNALTQYQTRKFYVSSSAGSDSNAGFTDASPFASIAKAVGVGLFPGDTVYLRSGDVWREDVRPVSPWASGVGNDKITFTTTGTARATILGSFQVATAWTLVSGTEYSTPLAAIPRNAFWINGAAIDETTVNKLVLNTPGTAGTLTVGQYAYSGGLLRINIGLDPTSQRIEVPRDGNAADSHIFYLPGYSCYRVENMNFYFGYVDGFYAEGRETVLYNSNCSWNGEDGCGSGASGQLDVLKSRFFANGGERTLLGGRGDGISFHASASGEMLDDEVVGNMKGGITNLSGCTVTIRRCYLTGNNGNFYILSVPGQSGIHTITSNVIVMRSDDAKIGINRDGTGNPAVIRCYNNTIYCPFASGVGINQPDDAKGNIVRGFPTGIVGLPGNVTIADHNCVFGATSAAYSGVTPGAGSITTDPNWIDHPNGDFRITRGSGCYGTGAGLGLPNFSGTVTNNIGAY